MSQSGLPVERLRGFLRELRPEARDLLTRELHRAAARGDDIPAAEVILGELRRLRDTGGGDAPAHDPAHIFIDVLEPFLFDGPAPAKFQGRIARASFDAICRWIGRDLMRSEVRAFDAQWAALAGQDDPSSIERLKAAFLDRAVAEIDQTLTFARGDEKAARRLAAQIGAAGALKDLEDFWAILSARATLSQLAARLPLRIRNLADEQLDHVRTVLCSPSARQPAAFGYAVVLVMSRLAQPWQLIRFAVRAAETDIASRVAETPYGRAVELVLAEIERAVFWLREDFERARMPDALARIKDIHDALRGFRTELDLSADSAWARQIASIRSAVSHLLRAEIEQLPSLVRRLLRVQPAAHVPAGARIDPDVVAQVETRMDLLTACRNHAGELALNEAAPRIHSDLQTYLEANAGALVERLRASGPFDRDFCRSQADAAVRLCGKMFGANYAGLLAKAAEAAYNSERKTAKA